MFKNMIYLCLRANDGKVGCVILIIVAILIFLFISGGILGKSGGIGGCARVFGR